MENNSNITDTLTKCQKNTELRDIMESKLESVQNLTDIIPYETCILINEEIQILNNELAQGEYNAGKKHVKYFG